MIVRSQRCQLKMKKICDDNAKSQNNAGYFWEFWFVSSQPTPGICQGQLNAGGMAAISLR